ncbi:MAG: hypothetical protein KBA33_02965 [Cloacibacterium sp.]|nr:hypothetical protein [Cloacibacterium sp.]
MTTPKTEPDLKTVLKTESICLSEEEKLELELDFCLAELEEFFMADFEEETETPETITI